MKKIFLILLITLFSSSLNANPSLSGLGTLSIWCGIGYRVIEFTENSFNMTKIFEGDNDGGRQDHFYINMENGKFMYIMTDKVSGVGCMISSGMINWISESLIPPSR